MRAVIADKAIYLEEYQLKMYTGSVLFVSQNLTDLSFALHHGNFYCTIIYWAVGFQNDIFKCFVTVTAVTLNDVCSVGMA